MQVINIFSEVGIDDNEENLLDKNFELITTAKQYDWRYGEFEYTKEDLEKMADYFNTDLLGIEVAVDKNHSSDKMAYAWIKPKSMIVAPSTRLAGQYSLFAKLYKFTPEGEGLLKTGAYRYFSLEIRNQFEKMIDGKKTIFKNVISGLAITNSPVIKDVSPTFSENNLLINSYNMETINKMLSELNAKEIVTRAEKDLLTSAVSVLSEEEAEKVTAEVSEVEAKPETVEPTEEEVEAETKEKELAEKVEADRVAKLSEVERKFEEQSKELAEMKEAVKAEKTQSILNGLMLSENNTTGFVADFKPTVETFLSTLSIEQAQEFSDLIKNIKTVDLSVKGSSSDEAITDGDLLDKKARELSTQEGISYRDAIIKLS